MRNFSGINFNYTNMLHLVLVIRIFFGKNLNYLKVQAARIMLKKSSLQVSDLLYMFKTKYYIKYSWEYVNFCYASIFLHKFKLNTELIND